MAVDMSVVFDNVGTVLDSYSDMKLPTWEELPDLPLYMDQVVSLMERYLTVNIPVVEGEEPLKSVKDSKLLTSSMVNNYVKMGIMPAPVKKKYERRHLAYLIMICLMKQSFSIPVLGVFLNNQVEAMGIETFYNLFVDKYREYFADYVKSIMKVYGELKEKYDHETQEAFMSIVALACANAGQLTCDTADACISRARDDEKKSK